MRVLLLGGTAEARVLAERLHPDIDVISSLAGRVPNPALPAGEVRIGGFGGAEPMRQWLVDSRVDAVVDATHPFAAVMTERTARVCGELGLPHLVLARPPWDSTDSIVVGSAAEAAKSYTRALELVVNDSERRFLERRLREGQSLGTSRSRSSTE